VRARVIETFLHRLSVENEGLSTAITVTFRARSSEKAARIANAVAETYVQSQLDTKFAATRDATDWLEGRVRDLSHQVQAADAAVERYKAEHNLSEGSQGVPLIEQQIGALDTQLVQAKADLAQKQATFARVDTLMKAGHGADISQAVASPLIIQLRSQEADLIRSEAELATKYGPKHPKLIAVQSQRHDLDEKISTEVSRVAGSLANDVSVARSQVETLESTLAASERQAQEQNLLRVQLKSLEVNAASTHSIYEAFVQRLRAIQDQSAIESSDARVISHAAAPNAPSSPQRPLIFAASIPAGLILGLLAALLAERFVPAAGATSANRHSAPLLAEIAGLGHPRAADLVVDWPTAPYARAVAELAHNIAESAVRGGPRAIVVTSPQAGEGATTFALSLARAAANLGRRVVVLDTNLAAPAAAPLAGHRSVPQGLSEVLAGRAPLSRSLVKDQKSRVLLLAPSEARADAQRVLGSAQLAQLIAHLRRSCDLLFVVAPPVLTSNSASVVARQADAVMLVTRLDPNPRPEVSLAVASLAPARRPVGMVLAT
jgi:Mrp family chromosome partitioning ATPase